MKFEETMKNEKVQKLASEIRLAVSEKFEVSIKETRTRRLKAQASFDRILDVPPTGIPLEEAASIVGLKVADLRNLVLSESIPYVDRKGHVCICSGFFPKQAHDVLGTEPTFLDMHAMMILTGTLQTPECKEIMEIALEAQRCLNKRMASGY